MTIDNGAADHRHLSNRHCLSMVQIVLGKPIKSDASAAMVLTMLKKMAMSKLNYLSLFFLLSQKAEAHCMSSSFLAEVIKCEKIWEKLALSFFLLSFPIFFSGL